MHEKILGIFSFREEMLLESTTHLLEKLKKKKKKKSMKPGNSKYWQGCGSSGALIQGSTQQNSHAGKWCHMNQQLHPWIFTQVKGKPIFTQNLYEKVRGCFIHDHPKQETTIISLNWEWISRLWYIHTKEYYSAILKDLILTQETI